MHAKYYLLAAVFLALSLNASAHAGDTPAPADAKVYFVNLEDGDKIRGSVKIVFGLSAMGVAPAGVDKENTGHHHVLVDRPPLGEGEDGAEEFLYSLPTDETHLHFGKGQTETRLSLAPGKHTLQLVLGDKDHIPHSRPIVSEVITVKVK